MDNRPDLVNEIYRLQDENEHLDKENAYYFRWLMFFGVATILLSLLLIMYCVV